MALLASPGHLRFFGLNVVLKPPMPYSMIVLVYVNSRALWLICSAFMTALMLICSEFLSPSVTPAWSAMVQAISLFLFLQISMSGFINWSIAVQYFCTSVPMRLSQSV